MVDLRKIKLVPIGYELLLYTMNMFALNSCANQDISDDS